jgi:autotransporter-associated beta strand protein
VFDETATGTTTVDISVGDVAPASVTFNNSTKTYTISSSSGFGITGSAGLIKNNGGTTNLNTPGSYSGGTTLNAGTLNLNASNAVGSGTTTVAGGTLGINNATGLGTGAITITGGALNNTSGSPLMLVNGNVQSWNGDFAFTGSNDLDMGTGAVTLGGSGSRTVTVNAGTLTVGAISSPTQGLTKAGPGKLAINPTSPLANSAIAGPLNVAAGTLQINTGSSAFDTMDFLANGLAGSGTIQNGGGVERSLVVNVDGNNTFSGKLEDGGAGALGLNKFGAGTLTLTGTTSTYTGTTTLTQGTLVAATPTALGSTSRVNAAANSTGTFRYATDGLDSVVPIGISSGSTVLNVVSDRATPGAAVDRTMTVPTGNGLGGGTVNFTAGPNVLSGTPKITFTQLGMGAGGGSQTTILNPTGVNLSLGDVSKFNSATAQTLALGGTSTGNEVTGVISNGSATVNISKTGSGTWKLLNANTFTGETSLTDGTLIATNTSALGGTSRLNITGTTGAGPTYIIATDGGDATLPIGINTGFTGTIATGRATAGPAVDRLMTVPTSSGLGNGTINFTVGPNVTSGIPRITFAQLGLGAGSGGTTTLNPVGVNLTLGDTSKFNNAPNQTLNLDGASTGNEITGVISNGTAIVSLSKSGASTWALTNTNSYTGTTTVNGGTLLVNGDNSGATGAVTVASGGVLGGTGKIGGDILMQAASTFATQFSGGTIDALDVGKLDLSALNNLLTVAGSGTSGPWTIINYSGTLTGTFESVTPGYTVNYGTGSNSAITISAAAGLLGDFNSDGKVDAGDYVTWRKNQNTNNALPNDNGLGTPVGTAHYNLWRANFGKPPGSGTGLAGASVPEPATWILVAMSAVMLSLVVRRRANTRLVLVPIGCPQSR